MKTLRLIFSLVLVLGASFQVSSQSRKTIKKSEVVSQTVYEYFIAEGRNDGQIEKIEKYDSLGYMIEQKVFTNDGDLKSWNKWQYNEEGDVLQEEIVDEKGRTVEKVIFEYDGRLLQKKEYYDKKNRLYKRKEYKYEFRQGD